MQGFIIALSFCNASYIRQSTPQSTLNKKYSKNNVSLLYTPGWKMLFMEYI